MTTTNREVIYTLRAEFDEAASRQSLDRLTQALQRVEKLKREEQKKTEELTIKSEERISKKTTETISKEESEAKKAEAAEQQRQERIFKNRVRLLDRLAREKRRKEAEELAETKRTLAQAERLQAASMQKIEALGEKLKGSLGQGAEGFLKMARGAAILGVSGEKDLQKLLEALAKIQAAFDIARGAVDLYFALAGGVKAYRDAVVAAKVAEDALAIARARSAAAGGVGGAAAAGSGLGAAGGLLGAAGGLGLAGGAAAFGIGAAGYSAYQFAQNDVTGSTEIPWFLRPTAMVSEYLSGDNRIGNMMVEQSSRQLAEEQGGAAMAREAERASREIAKMANAARDASITMNRVGGILAMGSLPGGDRIGAIGEAGGVVSARQAAVRAELAAPGGMDENRRQALMAEEADLAQQQVQLANERLQVEQEIYRTKRDEATESLSAMESELQMVQRIQQVERERLMTAKERFGAMSEAEQQRVLAVRRRAEEVGAANLSVEELQLLQGVGLTSTSRIASEGLTARAEAAGFGELVTGEDTAASEAAAARERELNVSIADQREIIVQIDADYERAEAELVAKIKEAFAQQQTAFEAAARNAAQLAISQYNREQNERRVASQQPMR